jgi:hypothetical protein
LRHLYEGSSRKRGIEHQNISIKEDDMAKEQKTESTGADMPKVNWDDSNMSTSYANVCNVSSSREEVTLLFGTNQAWHTGQKEVSIKLSDRIVMSPFAAKRLLALLGNVVGQYETRFGKLDIGVGPATGESKS